MNLRGKRLSELEVKSSRSDSIASPSSSLSRILPGRFKRKIKQLEDSQQEWVTGVFLCACGAFVILLINVVLTIVAASISYSKYKGQGYNYSTLYQGSCSTSKNLARGLHGLINVLSTLMLAASNYCMQCLSAPSRRSINEAHAQWKWLDIGVPSLKNLRSIGLKNQILWALLCITSAPIHLIYNSTVFSTLSTHEYSIYVASADFDPNDPPKQNLHYPNCFDELAAKDMPDLYSQIRKFDKLSAPKCQDAYMVDFNTQRGSVILVTNSPNVGNTSLLYAGTANWPERVGDPRGWGHSWLCDGGDCSKKILEKNTKTAHGAWPISAEVCPMPVISATILSDRRYTLNSTTPKYVPDFEVSGDELRDIERLKNRMWEQPPYEEIRQFLDDPSGWKNSTWAGAIEIQQLDNPCPYCSLSGSEFGSYPPAWPMQPYYSSTRWNVEATISHCLSEKLDEKCQLNFSLSLCLAVIVCNSIKVLAMFLTARGSRREILLTVGDAMSSFLSTPDEATVGDCLLSISSIESSKPSGPSSIDVQVLQQGHQSTLPKKKRWAHAMSRRYWILTITFILFIFLLSGFLLYEAIASIQNYGQGSLQGIWNLGFGTVTPSTIVLSNLGYSVFIPMVLQANAPQLIVSMAYFLYNNILTSMLLAAEYDGYGTHRKPLRVSWPKGQQRSTYYLTLPYKYSICLMTASAALHWLISQSLFFVAIIPYSPDGKPSPGYENVTCGFSPVAIIFAMSLGVLMVGTILALGMRRFKSNIPLASSCSAAISAACHPLSDDDHALKPIMWGEIQLPQSTSTSRSTDTNEETGYSSESGMDARGSEAGQARRDQPSCDEEQEIGVSLLFRNDVSDDSGESCGHCSFTSHEVITPSPLRRYA